MAKTRARPLSTAEAVLVATFAYLVLLISLTGARIGRESDREGDRGTTGLPAVARVAQVRPVAASTARASTCVGPGTVPYAYAAAPGVLEPLAFGPPAEPTRPLSTATVNGMLIQRLCGGLTAPGGPVRGPDRRLFAAIDAAVNGRDPNRLLSRQQWAAGVDRLIVRDGLFVDARVLTRTVDAGTPTFGMRVVSRDPHVDPVVIRTRLAHRDTSRYLLLPVRSERGRVVTLVLRLRCGFQPVF
ncbi:MAG: hypothetical protein ACJ73E_04940 [Mycobacteriales bacterium]